MDDLQSAAWALASLPAVQAPVKAPPIPAWWECQQQSASSVPAVQLPVKRPPESANTARAAVSSKSESTATTIALAVATPVGAQPKAPRRTAPNAHAIAEKSEVTTIATIA